MSFFIPLIAGYITDEETLFYIEYSEILESAGSNYNYYNTHAVRYPEGHNTKKYTSDHHLCFFLSQFGDSVLRSVGSGLNKRHFRPFFGRTKSGRFDF